jgi:hypothetical protein
VVGKLPSKKSAAGIPKGKRDRYFVKLVSLTDGSSGPVPQESVQAELLRARLYNSMNTVDSLDRWQCVELLAKEIERMKGGVMQRTI